MRRTRLSWALVMLLGVLWAVPSQRVYLLCLRELLRGGEAIGITLRHPAPGSRLAGQVLGFNYSQPPAAFFFIARGLSAAAALAPVLLPSLWLRRRSRADAGFVPAASRNSPIVRAAVSLATGGLVFALLERLSGDSLWGVYFELGEAIGAQVIRLGGFGMSSDGGPFVGGTAADAIGNRLIAYGPYSTMMLIAFTAAHLVHARLCQDDVRRAAGKSLCPRCGYDLSGGVAGARCPECGRAAGVPAKYP